MRGNTQHRRMSGANGGDTFSIVDRGESGQVLGLVRKVRDKFSKLRSKKGHLFTKFTHRLVS